MAAIPTSATRTHREILIIFSGLAAGMLLPALNATMVATALPAIVSDLGGLSQLAWVVTAYLLAATVSVPLFGKISDLYGRKPLFQLTIGIFVVGSVLCGLAQTMGQLIAFRVVQGTGGGALMALAMTTIADVVTPRQRGRYQGYIGSVFAVASVVGPLLGGLFVDHSTWRWAFFINLPLGLVALAVTGRYLHLVHERREHRIDYLGAALLTSGLVALLLVVLWGGDLYPWTSPVILGLGASAVLALAALLPVERRAAEPIIPLELFSDRTFRVGTTLSFVVGISLFGAVIFMPLFLQAAAGVSATRSGLLLVPLIGGVVVTSTVSGRLITSRGRYRVYPIVGMALCGVAFLLLARMTAETGLREASVYMALLGLGIGLVLQVVVLAIQNTVDPKHLGVATSATQLFRMVGGTIGVAALGAVLNARLTSSIPTAVPAGGADLDVQAIINEPSALTSLPEDVQVAVQSGLADAITFAFAWSVPIVALGFVVALLLREVPLRDG